MFESDRGLKIALYLYPTIFFALGTLGFLNEGWELFGVFLYGLASVVALHIIIVSVIREGRKHIQAEDYRLEEQRKLYETVMRMSPEEKYYFGLAYSPKSITVKKEEDNGLSQVWHKIPLPVYKLKVVAQAAINGEGFTVRKWAGDGKLLSREEWDATHKSFLELGMLEPVGNDPREGYMWTAFGEDVLSQIVKETL